MKAIYGKLWLFAVLGLTFAGAQPAFAQASTSKEMFSEPFDAVIANPCANNGAGEDVHVTGEIRFLATTVTDGSGGQHQMVQIKLEGVTGTGLSTGLTYQVVAMQHFETTTGTGSETTALISISLIAPGPGNNFVTSTTFHVTVNANGEITASHDSFTSECR